LDETWSSLSTFWGLALADFGRYLLDLKKPEISPASQTVATARIASKICQGQPPKCTRSAPDFIQIGSLSAELQPNA